MIGWREMTVGAAFLMPLDRRPILYSSRRGNQVMRIEQANDWYIVTYRSGGVRHVRAEQILYWKKP